MNLVSISKFINYWEIFPEALRVIIKVRLCTAIGAGGVLYLSPIIFNSLDFSAEQIGSGVTTAAFAGIATRFGTGYFLDRKLNYKKAIRVACLISIISDFILLFSQNYFTFLFGQFLLGGAAGIYWPCAEIAIPTNCNNKIKSNEGYSLARSADAIGVTLGVFTGTIGTYFEFTRIIYLIDIICMLYIFHMLINMLEISKNNEQVEIGLKRKYKLKNSGERIKKTWILVLLPLLSLTLFITGVMSLLQSILPLDLANGGIIRPALSEGRVASLLTVKLILLAIFQLPVGYILRNKNSSFKFRLCLISLLIGFIFISLSNFLINGYLLILIGFIPLTIALCIFLPSASDAIIRSSPIEYRGSAIALYSQCFGISALTVPWMAGKLIDTNNTAFHLWLIICFISILFIPICKRIK